MVSIVYTVSGLLVSLASMCTAMQLLPTGHDSHRFIKQRADDAGNNFLSIESMQNDGFDSEEMMQMETDFARRAEHAVEWMACQSSKEVREDLLNGSVHSPRKHVLHLHVHNSAGTWMCHTAEVEGGETVTQWPNNCNLELKLQGDGDSSRSLDGPFTNVVHEDFSGMTCAKRMAEMNKEKVTFSMIERWMSFEHGDWCPDDLLYTTIVRDPVKRAGTTIRDNFGDDQITVLQMLNSSLEAGNIVNVDWLKTHATFNDLLVRTLNGPRAMQLPMGKTTREHLEIAKNRLKMFDVVLAVPTLYTDTVQLVEHLEWPHVVNEVSRYSSKETKMNGELEKLLAEYNQLDQELYEFGLQLAWNRTEALLSKGGVCGGRT